MSTQAIYSYDNSQAIEDGIFADVTPSSMKDVRWIVTEGIHAAFSLAAIAEMYNEFVQAIRKSPTGWDASEPYVTKMNGQTVWCFLEQDVKLGKIVKIIFPSEY